MHIKLIQHEERKAEIMEKTHFKIITCSLIVTDCILQRKMRRYKIRNEAY